MKDKVVPDITEHTESNDSCEELQDELMNSMPLTDNTKRQNNKRRAEDEIHCENRPVVKAMRVCLKKNDTIEFKNDDGNSVKCVILGPAGKKSSEHRNWYNIELKDTTKLSMDFTDVDFNIVREEGEECMAVLPDELKNSDQCLEAKRKEIEKLKFFETYEEVEYKDQELITTRLVLVMTDNEVRARLVARGFEESDEGIVSDSPTILRVSFRSMIERLDFTDDIHKVSLFARAGS